MSTNLSALCGFKWHRGYLTPARQIKLLATVRRIIAASPLFQPEMPRTGKPLSVRMTNCGSLGWLTSKSGGYRYQQTHPETETPWPPIPADILEIWQDVAGFDHPPEACLINCYKPGAKLGLHVDRDEVEFAAPVVSISLGDDAWFRIGGLKRRDPTERILLKSGDVIVMGGASRLIHHGIDRILPGTSTLMDEPGRINLTLRRVSKAASSP